MWGYQAGKRVQNRPGQVEFCIGYIRDYPVRASAKKFYFPSLDMEHGLKHISFYVQKHTVAMAMCYNPVLAHDKPLGVPASVKLVYNF